MMEVVQVMYDTALYFPMKNTKNNMAAESISKAWLKGHIYVF